MTIVEVKKLIAVVTATYPGHYKSFTSDMMQNLVLSWGEIFKDYDYIRASEGLRRFIKSDTNGFPPVPGQIIDKMPSRYEEMLNETLKIDQHNLKRLSG